MTCFFDLSHPLQEGLTIFPGDPQLVIHPAEGAVEPWRVTDLHLGTHTGTHIDASSHYFPGGRTIDAYPVSRFILPGIVVPVDDLSEGQAISENDILCGLKNLPEGGAVLVQTQWDRFWNTDRYLRHPYLSPAAVERLVVAKASLVGIDALNVDSTPQATDHAHHTLLKREILIVENLTGLPQLQPGKVHQFSFLPLRWKGLDGSPIRAVAWDAQSS